MINNKLFIYFNYLFLRMKKMSIHKYNFFFDFFYYYYNLFMISFN